MRPLPVIAWTVAVAAINTAAALGPRSGRRIEKDVTGMSEQTPVYRTRLCNGSQHRPSRPTS